MSGDKVIASVKKSQAKIAEHVSGVMRSWADEFPEEDMRSAIASLEELRDSLEDTIMAYQDALEAVVLLRARTNENGNGHGARRQVTKRQAILELLAHRPDAEWALAEIRKALIQDGVMPNTEKAKHALQMTLQNMLKRYHEVERPHPGFYKLARSRAAKITPTSIHGKDDEA